MPKFNPGDTVAFSQAHVRRLGFDALLAAMRGVVIGDPYADNRHLRGKFVRVDFPQWPDVDGRRLGFYALLAAMRGVVIGDPYADNRQLRGKFVRVDFPQWPDVDGHTTCTIAASNLTRVLAGGVVFGD